MLLKIAQQLQKVIMEKRKKLSSSDNAFSRQVIIRLVDAIPCSKTSGGNEVTEGLGEIVVLFEIGLSVTVASRSSFLEQAISALAPGETVIVIKNQDLPEGTDCKHAALFLTELSYPGVPPDYTQWKRISTFLPLGLYFIVPEAFEQLLHIAKARIKEIFASYRTVPDQPRTTMNRDPILLKDTCCRVLGNKRPTSTICTFCDNTSVKKSYELPSSFVPFSRKVKVAIKEDDLKEFWGLIGLIFRHHELMGLVKELKLAENFSACVGCGLWDRDMLAQHVPLPFILDILQLVEKRLII